MQRKDSNSQRSGLADFVVAAGILLGLALAGQWSFGDYYSAREQEAYSNPASAD